MGKASAVDIWRASDGTDPTKHASRLLGIGLWLHMLVSHILTNCVSSQESQLLLAAGSLLAHGFGYRNGIGY